MATGVSATDSRVRLGRLIQELEGDSAPVLVEKENGPVAVAVPPAALARLRAGTIPSNWEAVADEARDIVRSWLQGAPMPDIDELIDYGRNDD